jgi:hypothetical protein
MIFANLFTSRKSSLLSTIPPKAVEHCRTPKRRRQQCVRSAGLVHAAFETAIWDKPGKGNKDVNAARDPRSDEG